MIRSLTMTLGATLALAGLSVALVVGLASSNHLSTSLERALVACGVCFLLGVIIGGLLDGVILRHAQDLRHQMTQTEPVDQSTLDQGSSESHGQTSAKVGERLPVV
jgi:threonine/homoserine/homoserine lactone efflux protein